MWKWHEIVKLKSKCFKGEENISEKGEEARNKTRNVKCLKKRKKKDEHQVINCCFMGESVYEIEAQKEQFAA